MLTYEGEPIRQQFNLASHVYLRTGNICLCPNVVASAMQQFIAVWRDSGDHCWDHAEDAFLKGKSIFAGLIGTDPSQLTTIENTSMGLSMAAYLTDPLPGSNIVVDELTHPSNIYPWLLRPGVELRYAQAQDGRVPLSEFERLIDQNTAAVDVCHVTMAHGFRHDLAKLGTLAHAHGALLIVDAAHSVGVVPVNVDNMNIDFLACPTFKWLFGPLGAGFLYVRQKLVDRRVPPLVGWMSSRNPEAFDVHRIELYDDARRLQRGVHNAVGLVAAAAGLEIIEQIGVASIWEHVRLLSKRLMDGLDRIGVPVVTPRSEDDRAGIVTITIPDAKEVQTKLGEQGIQVGHYLPGQIRMDVALFNNKEDIDRTLNVVETSMTFTEMS